MKILNKQDIDFHIVQNIIFDWGGVITNIDYHATVEAFAQLGMSDFNEFFTQHTQNELFQKFETGTITDIELYSELRKHSGLNLSDKDISDAWNAMLLDTPYHRIELLKRLRHKYNIYLLSNTNEIHVNYYNKYLADEYKIDYRNLFHKAYYSHEVKLRKPNADIFEYVIKDAGIDPKETLYIDDTEMHIDTASKLGIQSFFINNSTDIKDIF